MGLLEDEMFVVFAHWMQVRIDVMVVMIWTRHMSRIQVGLGQGERARTTSLTVSESHRISRG